jgi:hypothetical protein
MEAPIPKPAVQNLRTKEEIADYLLARTDELFAQRDGFARQSLIKALALATAEVLAGMSSRIEGKRPW